VAALLLSRRSCVNKGGDFARAVGIAIQTAASSALPAARDRTGEGV